MREWFPVNVGLRQGCVMYPWLFNVYMDGVVLGKGLELRSENGGGLCRLRRLVSEFGRVCGRRKLRYGMGVECT